MHWASIFVGFLLGAAVATIILGNILLKQQQQARSRLEVTPAKRDPS